MVSVGCVFIGDSSSQEVAQFTATDAKQHNQGVDSVISSINYDHYQEPVGDCTVVFDAVNPQNPAYQTVVIRNYRSVHTHAHTCMHTCTHAQEEDYTHYKLGYFTYLMGAFDPGAHC